MDASAKAFAKPTFTIGDDDLLSCLRAQHELARIQFTHEGLRKLGFRQPLGIYNSSITRVVKRLLKCCGTLERLFREANAAPYDIWTKNLADLADDIENVLYAATEHLDDLITIGENLLEDSPLAQFKKHIKKYARLIITSTNKVKHEQARIRTCSLQIIQGDRKIWLHGWYVERVIDGAIGAVDVFGKSGPRVFSATSLIWQVVVFLLHGSASLCVPLVQSRRPADLQSAKSDEPLETVIYRATRLPLYCFDEAHPFTTTSIKISCNADNSKEMDSGIYGSIFSPWNSQELQAVIFHAAIAGDGQSETFCITMPKSVKLSHWT